MEQTAIKKENNKTFEEACDIVRKNRITEDMTYEERLAVIKARFGL